MKTSSPLAVLALATLLVPVVSISSAWAQGSLTPPGSPAPTMKSLQEIWDRAVAIEGQNQVQQQQIAQLRLQNDAQSQVIAVLLEKSGVELPWLITTVDSSGNVGQDSSLAYTPGGQPAISYYDVTNTNLKYAVFDGTSWQISTVDSVGTVGRRSKLAFSPAGQPAISYYDVTNTNLKYAVFNGTSWQISTVSAVHEVGGLGFNPAGQPTVCFVDTTQHYLRVAVLVGATWGISDVYGSSQEDLYDPSAVVFGKDGRPAICFIAYDTEGGGDFVQFARHNGTSWQMVGPPSANSYDLSSPAFAPNGQTAFAGLDWDDTMVLYSYNGATWVRDWPDSGSSDAPSLAYTPSGKAAIAYKNTTDLGLKYAVVNGSAWQISAVDTMGATAKTSSLAFTPSGQPSLSYHDGVNGDLKFAVRSAFTVP